MIRNRHKIGDYLARCDDSGVVYYRSQLRRRWDGALVHPKSWETRQPQEFVQPLADPYPVPDVRPDGFAVSACNSIGVYIGATTVRVPTNGAAAHLYNPGVGLMEIGCSFVVR